jgi:hypothetical protein
VLTISYQLLQYIAKRAPSAYNVFMKTELPKVKAENPGMAHKEAFKVAAGRWKDSSDNPKVSNRQIILVIKEIFFVMFKCNRFIFFYIYIYIKNKTG